MEKVKIIKKIIFFLLVIVNAGISKLNAYCIYNKSNQKIYATVYSGRPMFGVPNQKAYYELKPGQKGCWNWKEIDSKNRNKEYYFFLTTKTRIAEGYFPIGGAVVFLGYKNNRADVTVYFGPDPNNMGPWQYQTLPWKHTTPPWKTYNR
jgi:hypothetical protein